MTKNLTQDPKVKDPNDIVFESGQESKYLSESKKNNLLIGGPKSSNQKVNQALKKHSSNISTQKKAGVGNMLGMIGEVSLFSGDKNQLMIKNIKGMNKDIRQKHQHMYRKHMNKNRLEVPSPGVRNSEVENMKEKTIKMRQ